MRVTKRRLLTERNITCVALHKWAFSSWYDPRIWKINNRFCRKVNISNCFNQQAKGWGRKLLLRVHWSSGQSFWLLITRSLVRFPSTMGIFPCGGRIPVVTMVWVVSRIRLKVETSSTRTQKSINNDWTHKRSPRWRGPHHVRESTS